MNKNRLKNVMVYSRLLSHDNGSIEYTPEDIKNMINEEVSDAHMALYIKVIRMLAVGFSYDSISKFIENYKFEDSDLLEDQISYIKIKTLNDLSKRKNNLKGEMINE